MKQKSNKNGFIVCAKAYIWKLQEEGRYSTAHVYKNAVLSFTKFCDTPGVSLHKSPATVCGDMGNIFTNTG